MATCYFLKRKERGKKWQKCGIIFEGSLQQKDKGKWTCTMTDEKDRKFIQAATIRYRTMITFKWFKICYNYIHFPTAHFLLKTFSFSDEDIRSRSSSERTTSTTSKTATTPSKFITLFLILKAFPMDSRPLLIFWLG